MVWECWGDGERCDGLSLIFVLDGAVKQERDWHHVPREVWALWPPWGCSRR